VNNPDALTGYAGLYGLALISGNWIIGGLALVSQIMNAMFLQIVEVPHMQKLYSEMVRKRGPIERVASEQLFKVVNKDELEKMAKSFRREVREVRQRASAEILTLYKNFREKKEQEKIPKSPTKTSRIPTIPKSPKSPQTPRKRFNQEVELKAPEKLTLGQPLKVQWKTHQNHSTTDWIGIYDASTPSLPGMSKGKWKYVSAGESGDVTFPPSALPDSDGVYEIRYHPNNQYKVLKRIPLVIESPEEHPHTEDEDDNEGDEGEDEEEE
jgi:phosphatidylethanolamine N-methyltransferase